MSDEAQYERDDVIRISRDEQKNRVKEYLESNCIGRELAVGKRTLSLSTGISERTIRTVINELIRDGMPVCSAVHDPCGYYIPATRQEAEEAINTLTSYARELEARIRLVEKNVRDMTVEPVQLDLFRRAG